MSWVVFLGHLGDSKSLRNELEVSRKLAVLLHLWWVN